MNNISLDKSHLVWRHWTVPLLIFSVLAIIPMIALAWYYQSPFIVLIPVVTSFFGAFSYMLAALIEMQR